MGNIVHSDNIYYPHYLVSRCGTHTIPFEKGQLIVIASYDPVDNDRTCTVYLEYMKRFAVQEIMSEDPDTFDTQITSEKIIRSRKDAEKLIRDYKGTGWGGTSFECVFDYADNFSKNNRGKKLKGLFFFSDAMGSFPEQKPKYRTTFFFPVNDEPMFFNDNYLSVPEWVELVKYKD